MRTYIPATLFLLIALLAACGGRMPGVPPPTPPAQGVPRPATPTDVAPPTVPAQTPTARRDPTATLAAMLESGWYEDSDGDGYPDLLEQGTGYDPQRNDCADLLAACGSPEQLEAGLSLLERPHNLLLLLDVSGSMAEPVGGEPKLDVAKAVLKRYLESAPPFVATGLIAYGHTGDASDAGRPASCAGPELLAVPGALTPEASAPLLAQLRPTGWTPIGGAVRLAAQTLEASPDANNRVVLITDGLETCGGDPLAELRAAQAAGISVTVDVVGFAIDDDVAALRELAAAGGGQYYSASSGAELDAYFDAYFAQLQQAIDAADAQISCVIRSYSDFASCCVDQYAAAKSYLASTARELREQGNAALADQLTPIMDSVDSAHERRIAEQRALHDPRLEGAVEQRRQLHDQLVAAIRQRAAR